MKLNTKITILVILSSILGGISTLPITIGLVTERPFVALLSIPFIVLVIYGFKLFKKLVKGCIMDENNNSLNLSSSELCKNNLRYLNLKSSSNTLHVSGSPMSISISKQYTIDMDKVLKSKNINEKLDSILTIFSEMNITIQGWAMTETLKKYIKEKK